MKRLWIEHKMGMQIYRGVMKSFVTCTYINSNDSHLIESMFIEMIVFKITNMIELLVDMVGLISFFNYKKLNSNSFFFLLLD
jgi:hypothetical protein